MTASRPRRATARAAGVLLLAAAAALGTGGARAAPPPAPGVRFRVCFSKQARAEPLTGRVYVAIARAVGDGRGTPIQQVGETGVPFFGLNVSDLAPGAPAVIDRGVVGYPIERIDDLPAGDYWVQPFVNVYTRFDRADGHTVWLHMDRWEGQSWRRSPGNLWGEPTRVRIDPAAGTDVELVCDRVIPPIELPPDTDYVERFKIRSEILSRWWGRDIHLGATVLLPRGYAEHPQARFPVCYVQGHFSLGAPAGFGQRMPFTRKWLGQSTPRFIFVTLQHPSPYYDDSYGVNSANNGPYGDAIVKELIPEVERRFRVIREPWARLLTGGSTGGWIALAMQVFHPELFGGAWSFCPDSVDFRYHQLVDIYSDENAYYTPHEWMRVERPTRRRTDGNVAAMMKDENLFELAVGDRSRSGGQWDIWEATFSPVGPDGYPKRLWDKRTGEIDHEVAEHWRRYDLRHILETRWAELGPKLRGKLHIYVGDMDDYYLNNGVRLLEEFLQSADPPYEGSVTYERNEGHCWGPGYAELIDLMTAHIDRRAPKGADLTSWRYRTERRFY